MKRLLNITILLLYVAFSAGVTLSWHYCGDKLKGVSLLSSAAMCDGCSGKSECCHSEEQSLKIEDFQNTTAQISAPSVEILALFSVMFVENTDVYAETISFYSVYLKNAPPPDGVDIPVRDCRFRC